MRDERSCRLAAVALGALLLLPIPGQAQVQCPDVEDLQELEAVPELVASGGGLSLELDVQMKTVCIPTAAKSATPDPVTGKTTYTASPLDLRTYVYQDPVSKQPAWGPPGPTLRLRKASQLGGRGDGLSILLKNSLAFDSGSTCDSPCPTGTDCSSCDATWLQSKIAACALQQAQGVPFSQDCCCIIQCNQTAPNCFHGDNVTNLHFHGSHVSPQAPQDFVLLDLYPVNPAGAPAADGHGTHGVHSRIGYGSFQYRIPEFGWKQPEGTHWYHPHRHGSVGMQITNGMAGTLIVEGPFDEWLRNQYGGKLVEKVLVIQQIAAQENLFNPNAALPLTLVNGQINPTITVQPGEVQRWRILNAGMSSNLVLQITLPTSTGGGASLVFRQIAFDGIRFSPINYECQPLFNFIYSAPAFPCLTATTTTLPSPTLTFSPGNRADFLVQMPLQETVPGKPLRVERKLAEIPGEGSQRQRLRARDETLAAGAAEPALFHVVVDDGIAGNEATPKAAAAGQQLPATLPPMPDYLQNITADEVKGNAVALTFQQTIAGTTTPWPYAGSPLAQFLIDGRQFDASCANVTRKLGTAAEWTIGNTTTIPHPFHIHTNPFQLVSFGGVPVQPAGQTKPEPIWMDTLLLPLATAVPNPPDPTNPLGPITITPAYATTRQRYEDFTGEYVLHCHFLGHEDRGMMFAVQTVCADQPDSYGLADGTPECKGKLVPAIPACK